MLHFKAKYFKNQLLLNLHTQA